MSNRFTFSFDTSLYAWKRRLRYLYDASAGQRRSILLSSLVGVAGVFLGLAFIFTSKCVIDIATRAQEGSLVGMAVATVVLVVLQLLCSMADEWIAARMEVDTENALRHRIFSRLLRSRWSELEKFHTGDVVNRVEQDTTAIVGVLTTSLPVLVVTSIQLLAGLLFFCYLDPRLPWLVVAILPLFLLGSRFYLRRMHRFTHDIRSSDSHIQSLIQESLQHRTVIKTLEQDGNRVEQLRDVQQTLRHKVMGRTRFSVSAHALVSAAFAGGYLTAFLWGAVRLSLGTISFGTMTAFLQLVGKVQRPLLDMARLVPAFIKAMTAVDRLLELESLPAEASGEEQLRFCPTPDLVLTNVTFGYGGESRSVFRHFSHTFRAGSCTAIMGETGSGKTTLIRLLLALAAPGEGSVSLRGVLMGSQSTEVGECEVEVSERTRVNFVYVPQGNTLFSGTVRDNLLMGNPDATDDDLCRVLHTATADFVFHLPQGLDTHLGEQGGGLSEGQAQRLAIARALLRPGSILLLDEATSALDPDTEQRLLANLRQDCQGKTFIFVTHHPVLAEGCGEVVRLGE